MATSRLSPRERIALDRQALGEMASPVGAINRGRIKISMGRPLGDEGPNAVTLFNREDPLAQLRTRLPRTIRLEEGVEHQTMFVHGNQIGPGIPAPGEFEFVNFAMRVPNAFRLLTRNGLTGRQPIFCGVCWGAERGIGPDHWSTAQLISNQFRVPTVGSFEPIFIDAGGGVWVELGSLESFAPMPLGPGM